MSTAPLLETKLHAPRARRGLVPRPRLTERVQRRDHPALTLVSAPAGFGKTTLLTQWFGDVDPERRTTAWVSLDARDSDPTLFWSYVIAALRTIEPSVGEGASSLLQSAPSPPDPIVASLLNDLERVDHDIALVLDDYHVIESSDVHHAMGMLLEHLPPNVRLVIASRADPPMPLARMRARGELLEIRGADLRFTAGEATAYFNDSMGLRLSEGDVRALEDRTEGWIAALQLAALSMQGRDDVDRFIATFTGDDRFVVDYLVEEVLERQPAEVRDFLLQTSVLGRLTGSLCDAVTDGSGGRATLEMLDRANLFVVPLDDRRLWYRYHHLFADVLRARLLDEHADRVATLHRRASAWYDANGDPPEAIAHAMASADAIDAARLIELAMPMMRQTRQETTLRRWLEDLPDEVFASRPVLAVSLVGARMSTGDPTGVEALLDQVDEQLGAASRDPAAPKLIVYDTTELSRLPAQIAMYRAALALLAGDPASTVAHAERARSLTDPDDQFGLGATAALTGLARWTNGDLVTARARYEESVARFTSAGYLPDVLGCSLALADIQIAQGRLHDATKTYEAGLALARDHALRGTPDMHVGLSEVLLERNELADADRQLQLGRDLGDHAGLPQNAYRWRAAAARLRHARGDHAGALALLDEAAEVYNTDFSPPIRPIHAMKARVRLELGDVAGATRWAEVHAVSADDELDYVREYEHITLARVLLARHAAQPTGDDLERAVMLLTRLLAEAERGARMGSTIEILILLTLAHRSQGAEHEAAATLERARDLAEVTGHVRLFVDAGLATTTAPVSTTPASTRTTSGLVDELSSRELDVLRLLRSDLSGPDIARELFVSLNTLRSHTKNIYAKLGVNNRREAVTRAAELGLQ